MESGKLRHKLTIQRATHSADTHGEDVETWSDLVIVRGSIKPVSAKEKFDSDQHKSEITHIVKIRYYAGLTSADRLLFNSRVFNFAGEPINKDELNKELEITCIEDPNA